MKAITVVGLIVVLLCFYEAVEAGYNPQAVAQFADSQWDCGDPDCSYKVNSGEPQNNYECAEFVSRSLAAGGYIPNLSPTAPQSDFQNYQYNGQTYDLLWVSSKQGPPLGMQDFLQAYGWTQTSTCVLPNVLIVNGGEGCYTHTGICVGNNIVDAHNNARYHVSPSGIGTLCIGLAPNGNGSTTSSSSSSGSSNPSGSSNSGSSQPSGSSSGSNSGSSSGNSNPSSSSSSSSSNSFTSSTNPSTSGPSTSGPGTSSSGYTQSTSSTNPSTSGPSTSGSSGYTQSSSGAYSSGDSSSGSTSGSASTASTGSTGSTRRYSSGGIQGYTSSGGY